MGDITLIAKNTTDDFDLTDPDGKVQNKNHALADVKEEKNIKSWTITDAELVSASEDSAVLKYVLGVMPKTGQSGKASVTDTFVKKTAAECNGNSPDGNKAEPGLDLRLRVRPGGFGPQIEDADFGG